MEELHILLAPPRPPRKCKPLDNVSRSGQNPVILAAFHLKIFNRTSIFRSWHFKVQTLWLGFVWHHHTAVISCFGQSNYGISHQTQDEMKRPSHEKTSCWPPCFCGHISGKRSVAYSLLKRFRSPCWKVKIKRKKEREKNCCFLFVALTWVTLFNSFPDKRVLAEVGVI